MDADFLRDQFGPGDFVLVTHGTGNARRHGRIMGWTRHGAVRVDLIRVDRSGGRPGTWTKPVSISPDHVLRGVGEAEFRDYMRRNGWL